MIVEKFNKVTILVHHATTLHCSKSEMEIIFKLCHSALCVKFQCLQCFLITLFCTSHLAYPGINIDSGTQSKALLLYCKIGKDHFDYMFHCV